MKSVRWNLKFAPLALAVAATLAACGGGGDSDSSNTTLTLSGDAAKGALANAIVTAHAIKADGSIDPVALATAPTDTSGHYTNLSFSAVPGAPYVIQIDAKSDGTTTQLDEVTGVPQAMPANFSMRSLFTKSVAGPMTATASITPFSEMAVDAASRGTNGITAANAAQAITNVTTLLGFNPTTITPTTIVAAAPGEQQKLALFLTALSRLANDSALGCTDTNAGVRVKCVVNTLASTSTLSSTIPSTAVATALSGAILAVATDSRLTGSKVDTSTLTSTLVTLARDGSTTPATNEVTAIASAKLLFTSIKSDVTTLFSRRNATSLGAVNVEANAFIAAMENVQVPAEMLVKDSGALLMGIDLYNDFQAGRETSNFRVRGKNQFATDRTGPATYFPSGVDLCSLYADSAFTIPATSPANARYIGCSVLYYYTGANSYFVSNVWRHEFTITPKSASTFDYLTSAVQSVAESTCTSYPCTTKFSSTTLMKNVNGTPSKFFSGTVSVTTGNDAFTTKETEGHITAFNLTGELPGAFKTGANTLTNNHHNVVLSGKRTFGKDVTGRAYSVSTLNGSVTAFADDMSPLGTLTINSGSLTDTEIAATSDGSSESKISGGSLDLKWTTEKSEAAGVLNLDKWVFDKSGHYNHKASHVTFTGALRNKGSDGTFADFISGSITSDIMGLPSYDPFAPPSVTNDYTRSISFVAAVTAPGRPKLELSGNLSRSEFTKELKTSSLQYRTLAASTPRMVIAISVNPATSSAPASFKLSEAGSNLSMTVVSGSGSTDLFYNSTLKVGTFNSATKLLTFTNGDFISLDVGI